MALLLMACMLMASDAAASGSIFIGLDLPSNGAAIGGSDFGWNFGGYFTTPLSPVIDVGGLVAYNRFISTLSGLPVIGELFEYEFQPWELQALGQFRFMGNDSQALRGFAGLGLANYNQLDVGGSSGRRTEFAWQAGLAGKVEWMEFRVGYHWVDLGGSPVTWYAITVGVVF